MNKCFDGAIRYANTGIAFLYDFQANYNMVFQVELVVILLAAVLL